MTGDKIMSHFVCGRRFQQDLLESMLIISGTQDSGPVLKTEGCTNFTGKMFVSFYPT